MKAIVVDRFGPPKALQLKEEVKPVPKENEVLIKIHATAVNDWDWSMVRGKPYPYRLMFGIIKPKRKIPGMELAGTVEALGPKATSFKVGDAVYGDISDYGFGSFAEYVCVNERSVLLKPRGMTFEEAASIPHAAALAMQGLVDVGKIRKGQKILINGAGGGMGTFGLQISKLYDAEVTGVDSDAKLKTMKALGFDHVINYQTEDFTRNGQRYDLILDAKTNRSPFRYLRSLKPGGKYVTVGGHLFRLLQLLVLKYWITRFRKRSMHIVALKPNKDLDHISQLFESGKVKPVIDGPHNLAELPKVLQYFGEGKHQGKVVISLSNAEKTQ